MPFSLNNIGDKFLKNIMNFKRAFFNRVVYVVILVESGWTKNNIESENISKITRYRETISEYFKVK